MIRNFLFVIIGLCVCFFLLLISITLVSGEVKAQVETETLWLVEHHNGQVRFGVVYDSNTLDVINLVIDNKSTKEARTLIRNSKNRFESDLRSNNEIRKEKSVTDLNISLRRNRNTNALEFPHTFRTSW